MHVKLEVPTIGPHILTCGNMPPPQPIYVKKQVTRIQDTISLFLYILK